MYPIRVTDSANAFTISEFFLVYPNTNWSQNYFAEGFGARIAKLLNLSMLKMKEEGGVHDVKKEISRVDNIQT